jgi:hypothetical protein
MRTQNIKKELNEDMEKLRKKESNRNLGNKKTLWSSKKHSTGHSCRLEQVEDRISELEHKIEIKKKKKS